MRILLVEDEPPKRQHIVTYVEARVIRAHVEVAKSVKSAIEKLRVNPPDLMLLDMSLPTFDVGPEEPGGRPQGFGGAEVLRYMDLYEIVVPTIVVTAYEAFFKEGREVNLGSLSEELYKEHSMSFRGLVYYNSLIGGWQDELGRLIASQFEGAVRL